jgi:dihydrofolate synthase/folylpolyglutamate synthase
MTYDETIEYLFNSTPLFQNVGKAAYKEGLANTLALDEYFGHPHTQFKTIHVGGTNGKGSTSHSLASVLQSAGYKVGLFTSPHLKDFRERIRINGEMISEEYVVDFVEQHRSFFEPLYPSFFELTTAMAFKYFADEKVDVAVIEVGLGGRLDCTNIITPVLSIITNISFDHVNLLGNTLEKIASEKAGIIKHGVPVVIGETTSETRTVFETKAKEVGTQIVFAEEKEIPEIPFELGGDYQQKNLRTILTALSILRSSFNISEQNISYGLSNVCEQTGLMGRWQTLKEFPKTVCDVGHNVGGFEYIVKQLTRQQYKTLRIVIGMVNDKDINGVLALLPKDAKYYFTKAKVARALQPEELQEKAKEYGLNGNCYPSVTEAYEAAVKEASTDDFIFIGGSCFVVAEVV